MEYEQDGEVQSESFHNNKYLIHKYVPRHSKRQIVVCLNFVIDQSET